MAWITTATVYLVVVLTAMQVGLSTDALKDNNTFQRASYGFTDGHLSSEIMPWLRQPWQLPRGFSQVKTGDTAEMFSYGEKHVSKQPVWLA
ncbi:UDP-N-acetylglucosamine transferase subunit ALG13 [Colletotrichum asianum]|uniref:UDP-N-acetylglucosamine transferase subunit ALG13 n=1 Tax=Colletotrichum asianum TaxID=702518 RepID=A0A8H3W120_9PEZI|nr:UDP-N-acetylglucosamine transferase subunit ALG13 [Colletotrichum asianum]